MLLIGMNMKLKRGRYFVTHKCNLSCPYCLTDSGTERYNELEAEELRPIFEKFRLAGMESIGISGGEPFLVFERTLAACKIFRELGIKVRVFTNGTLTTKEKVQAFLDENVEAFHVSIDGLEGTHDDVRGKGTWVNAMDTIRLMKELGAKVRTVTLVRPENLHEVEELVSLFTDMNVDEIYLKEINISVGRGKTYEREPLNLKELPDSVRLPNVTIKEYGHFKAECDSMSINPDGSLISCGQIQSGLGNGFTADLNKVFDPNRICRFRNITDRKNGAGSICCDY